jgi:DNA-dependent RNA polymerase auxiliary subunit epsilon
MHRDYVSINAYNGINNASFEFDCDLWLFFEELLESCRTEKEYLDKVENLIRSWLHRTDYDELTKELFIDQLPEEDFKQALKQIFINIHFIKRIPEEKRRYGMG